MVLMLSCRQLQARKLAMSYNVIYVFHSQNYLQGLVPFSLTDY